MKQNKGLVCGGLSVGCAVLHLLAALFAINRLPEMGPTHFDMHWVCDGVGSRWTLLFVVVLPLGTAAVSLVTAMLSRKQTNLTQVMLLLLTLYFIAMFWMLYPTVSSAAQIGDQIEPQAFASLMLLAYAVMFIAIGNYLPVLQPNQTLGIRVSWTMNNPVCWRRTHRFAGRLWVITGLLMCLIVFAALAVHHSGEVWILIVFGEFVVVNIAVPCIYAWMHKDDSANA